MKRIALLLLCLGPLNPVVLGQVDQAEVQVDAESQAKLEYAGASHEIISILIEEGKYVTVLPEFRKILELGLEGQDETLVVVSALTFAESLTEAGQHGIAQQILDSSISQLRERASKYTLLMYKAKYFKDQGRTQEAIEIYRKAQQLPD